MRNGSLLIIYCHASLGDLQASGSTDRQTHVLRVESEKLEFRVRIHIIDYNDNIANLHSDGGIKAHC